MVLTIVICMHYAHYHNNMYNDNSLRLQLMPKLAKLTAIVSTADNINK